MSVAPIFNSSEYISIVVAIRSSPVMVLRSSCNAVS